MILCVSVSPSSVILSLILETDESHLLWYLRPRPSLHVNVVVIGTQCFLLLTEEKKGNPSKGSKSKPESETEILKLHSVHAMKANRASLKIYRFAGYVKFGFPYFGDMLKAVASILIAFHVFGFILFWNQHRSSERQRHIIIMLEKQRKLRKVGHLIKSVYVHTRITFHTML